ncbi:MAG TPA: right-handed parallel beta-helix repeat-containing protein [Methanotrichaceae archaeon]|nr:right-handed parallel beta-helix repeat-containing protein [Methanotrichaceae archaeon]
MPGISFYLLLALSISLLSGPSLCATIQAESDVQAAIDQASPGDTVLVGPGQYGPFQVDKPLTIKGVGGPTVQARVQIPGMTLDADGISVSGFKVQGMSGDQASKFDYYMAHRDDAGLKLDLPNAAILVDGDDASISETAVFGAQVGIYSDSSSGLDVRNASFDSCDNGVQLLNCYKSTVASSTFAAIKKYGLNIEDSTNVTVSGNRIKDAKNFGLLLKDSLGCNVEGNSISGSTEGIALWNTTQSEVGKNYVTKNYYGILLSDSDDNLVIDNRAEENLRSEIISNFGMGISLQDNSSDNIVARNLVHKNFNGLELTRGTTSNVVYSNNVSDNTNGIRVDKNFGNLIYHNNFIKNTVNLYDNATHNFWNASVGNYYSDYKGVDRNGDGIGDKSYKVPKGSSEAWDFRPLASPCNTSELDIAALKADLRKYAIYVPPDDRPLKKVDGEMVIKSSVPRGPPKFTPNSLDF